MAYQSKTWSLSDEVVEAVEAARLRGETPNQFFKRLIKEWEYACREATIHDCDDANLDATGPELSSGKGKASIETQRVRDARQAAGKMNRTPLKPSEKKV